jgi:hypothetical protein
MKKSPYNLLESVNAATPAVLPRQLVVFIAYNNTIYVVNKTVRANSSGTTIPVSKLFHTTDRSRPVNIRVRRVALSCLAVLDPRNAGARTAVQFHMLLNNFYQNLRHLKPSKQELGRPLPTN